MKHLTREWIKENVLTKFDQHLLPDLYMLEEIIEAKDKQLDIKKFLDNCQNDDGGFKAWLEPDIQSEQSTMIATSVALSIYHYLGDIDERVATKVAGYLNDKFNHEEQRWNIVSSDITTDPHAFWWNKEIEPTFGYVNPSAQIIAYACSLNIEVDESIVEMIKTNISKLEVMEDIHDYSCLVDYYKIMDIEIPEFVLEGVKKLMVTDPKEWCNYVPRPLDVITSTTHPLYRRYQDQVNDNLDYLIEELEEHKVLSPTWSWGQFEDDFDQAKAMWQQRLTYKAINNLYKFGRIK